MKQTLFIPKIAGIRLKLSAMMKITSVLAALILAACPLESDLTISNAEYTDKNTLCVIFLPRIYRRRRHPWRLNFFYFYE
jgi:hypothetical protein